MTLNHIIGYSIPELLKETKEGIKLFNEFKVTNAKQFLIRYQQTGIIGKSEQFKKELADRLSDIPIIALAQLNELFLHQLENKPKRKVSIFKTSPQRKCYRESQRLLKELYFETMQKFVKIANVKNELKEKKELKSESKDTSIPKEYGQIASMEAFESIVIRHQIIFDDHYPCDYVAIGKTLYDSVFAMMKQYPFQKPDNEETRELLRDFGPFRKLSLDD